MSQCSAQLGSNSASIESKVMRRTFPKYDYADYAHIAIPNHKPHVSLAKLQPGCHALLLYGVYVSIDRNKTVVGLGSFSERLAWPSLQNEAMPMQASPKTLSPGSG